MGIQLILVCNIILLYVPVHCVSCEIWQEKQTVFQSNRNYTANMAYDFYHIFVIIPLATMEELRRKTKKVTWLAWGIVLNQMTKRIGMNFSHDWLEQRTETWFHAPLKWNEQKKTSEFFSTQNESVNFLCGRTQPTATTNGKILVHLAHFTECFSIKKIKQNSTHRQQQHSAKNVWSNKHEKCTLLRNGMAVLHRDIIVADKI